LVLLNNVCWQEEGHDVAECAVLAAVILAIRDWHDPIDWLARG
jgi:hypothetical protein